MTTECFINIIAHCTTAFSSLGLLIHVFGDPDNEIWDNQIKAWLAKGGLSITVCGAVLNVLSPTETSLHEVILNIGISITFFWLNWWQWEMFKEIQAKAKKRPRKNRKPRAQRTKK
jgi:hypothetical protein